MGLTRWWTMTAQLLRGQRRPQGTQASPVPTARRPPQGPFPGAAPGQRMALASVYPPVKWDCAHVPVGGSARHRQGSPLAAPRAPARNHNALLFITRWRPAAPVNTFLQRVIHRPTDSWSEAQGAPGAGPAGAGPGGGLQGRCGGGGGGGRRGGWGLQSPLHRLLPGDPQGAGHNPSAAPTPSYPPLGFSPVQSPLGPSGTHTGRGRQQKTGIRAPSAGRGARALVLPGGAASASCLRQGL